MTDSMQDCICQGADIVEEILQYRLKKKQGHNNVTLLFYPKHNDVM